MGMPPTLFCMTMSASLLSLAVSATSPTPLATKRSYSADWSSMGMTHWGMTQLRMAQRSAEVRLRWVRCLHDKARRAQAKANRVFGGAMLSSPSADIE